MFLLKHEFQHVNTVPLCISFCRELGYVYAGVQFEFECFCGNTFPRADKYPKLAEKECGKVCPGNATQMCGGLWANSVYETGVEIFVIKADGTEAILENENYWRQ
ncbi:xylosyltransferase oxt-like [Culicoides brevitarsis]|uniref:xylosyltransferase oxt-like n=1 Tax=Culicoides brevitarsis TaxID=469753 RepID=UPI00307C8B42